MTNRAAALKSRTFPNLKSEVYLYGMHTGVTGKGWLCQRHLHHMMVEVNLVLSGTQTAIMDHAVYEQQAGDLLIIPPMKPHRYKSDRQEPLHYFVMHVQVSDTAFMQLMNNCEQLHYPKGDPLNEKLRPIIMQLIEQLQEDDSHSQIALFANALMMMSLLERHMKTQQSDSPHYSEETLPSLIAREIEMLITFRPSDSEDRFETREPLHNWLAQIAEKLLISRRHCYRVFQQAYRMSPRDYLAVLRQQEAMHSLVNSDDSLEQIAYRIGFENVQSFIRQFSKWTGMTPGSFRRSERDSLHYLTPLELKLELEQQ